MEELLSRIEEHLAKGEYEPGIKLVEQALRDNPHEHSVVSLQVELYIRKYLPGMPSVRSTAAEIEVETLTAAVPEPGPEEVAAALPAQEEPVPAAALETAPDPAEQTAVPDMVLCFSCGKVNSLSATSCVRCGEPLKETVQAVEEETEAGDDSRPGFPVLTPGFASTALAVISIFFAPEITGPAAVIAGVIAYMKGERAAGLAGAAGGAGLFLLRVFGIKTFSYWLF